MEFRTIFAASLAGLLCACGHPDDGATPQPGMRMLANTSATVSPAAAGIGGYLGNYIVTRGDDGVTVKSRLDGQTSLYPASTLQIRFVDKQLDFDVDGLPGQVYRLY